MNDYNANRARYVSSKQSLFHKKYVSVTRVNDFNNNEDKTFGLQRTVKKKL